MLAVARRALGVSPDGASPAAALPSLRSDGLLLPFSAGASWRPADEFADDVVRDLATSRLLMISGLSLLATAAAPRWAVHAALVACQAQLLRHADDLAAAMDALVSECAEVAAVSGGRWADLPWEALLTSPLTTRLLDQSEIDLTGQRTQWLRELIRVARQRFVNGVVGDVLAVEPIVDWLARMHLAGKQLPYDLREAADEITIAWLRGVSTQPVADRDADAGAVRVRVRQALRSRAAIDSRDGTVLLGLALLDGDLEQRDRELLLDVAQKRGAFLDEVVEDVIAPRALAAIDPGLLAAVTLGYYADERTDHYSSWHDNGIRRHKHMWGYGVPPAAWYFGPFWTLLTADLSVGLTTIDRLLKHAVRAGGEAPIVRRWSLLAQGVRDY
jgi:hypothetical protein